MVLKITRTALFIVVVFVFQTTTISKAQSVLNKAEAEKLIQGTELIRFNKSSEVPSYIQFRHGAEKDLSELNQWIYTSLHLDHTMGLLLLSQEKDKLGMIHYRYQETCNGFPIEGTMYIVHTKNNKIVSMNGFIFNQLTNSVSSNSVTEETALQNALTYTHAERYRWQNPVLESQLKETMKQENATWFPKGTLVYAPFKGDFKKNNYRLTYKFDIYAEQPLKRNFVFVDANSGEIIFEQNRIKDANVPATGVTVYSGNRPIMTDSNGGGYRLHETGRGNGIITYNNLKAANPTGTTDFTNSTTTWNNINSDLDQYATDAHWGAEKTYDYYDSLFNRNSIDDAGFALLSYVHVDVNMVNAFWDGQSMSYGDGDSTQGYTPLTTLDVTGHEITHGLTQFTSNLGNVPEGGALNEGFSDCMGNSIRHYALNSGTIDWLIGDMIGGTPFRDMANPHNLQNPDTYLGQYWDAVNQEVHQNSTILSHCYYLLAMGGSGTNDNSDVYSVTPLGIDVVEQIWYRMNTVYLNPNSDYSEARLYSIQSAVDLFGGCSPEVVDVTNAWFAVGVGAAYVPGSTVCSFTASPTSYCSLPANVHFTNTTTNGGGYTWYFGDGTTSNSNDPIHTYMNAGNYTVKLLANSSCGMDSITTANLISIVPLTSPTVNSPVATSCGSPATLTANGVSLSWYSSPMGGSALDTGTTFITPLLNSTTTFYVQSAVSSPSVYSTPIDNTMGAGGNFTNTNTHYQVFDVNQPCTLVSVLVYATNAGNRTITLSNFAGTVLNTATVNIPNGQSRVTLNFPLTVGSSFQLGCGGNVNLYRNSAGASYPYNDPIGLVSITGNDVPDPARYYYFYDWELRSAPCTSALVPVVVNVSGGISPSFTYTQSTNSVSFTNTSQNGTSWIWNFGDGNTDITQNPVHTFSANGTYTVTLLVSTGSCTDSISQTITIYGLGVDNGSSLADFELLPNPTDGKFELRFTKLGNESVSIKIINTLGQTMLKELRHLSSGRNSITFDLSDFSNGIYFVQINDSNNFTINKRIIKN
ncbi:MAG: M4 family metallopeptidase [Bacteroidota bacterium]